MSITVTYFGQLRALAQTDRQVVDSPAHTSDLKALLSHLAQSSGDTFASLVSPDAGEGSGPDQSVLVVVNDQAVPRGQWPALKDGDEVALMPAIGGG